MWEEPVDPEEITQPVSINTAATQAIPAAPKIEQINSQKPAEIPSFPVRPVMANPLPTRPPVINSKQHKPQPGKKSSPIGCMLLFILAIGLLYLLAPLRTNILLLGVDRTPDGTALGRTDTIILVSVNPLLPVVNWLSIPRDLWVSIPGYGENRINTAHFFAEIDSPGSGPKSVTRTIEENFGVRVPYYVRIQFDGFKDVINAMGGVTVNLEEPMAGYDAGKHHLDADQSLAFVRDRKGTDDFFRMRNTQVFLKSAILQMLSPTSWPRIPSVLLEVFQSIKTNLPVWEWPRIGLALARASLTGMNTQTITREMVTPYTTAEGANVLLPDYAQISALMKEMFSSGFSFDFLIPTNLFQ